MVWPSLQKEPYSALPVPPGTNGPASKYEHTIIKDVQRERSRSPGKFSQSERNQRG